MRSISWRFLLVLIALSALAGAALAQSSLSLVLPRGEHSVTAITVTVPDRGFDQYGHCLGGIATTLFTHSNHPGPNRGFNENNDGQDGRCYLNRGRNFYFTLKGLVNSQYGDTLGIGFGFKVRPIEVDGFSIIKRVALDTGFDASLIHYVRYFGRGAVTAPLVSPHVGFSITFEGGIEVGMVQYYLRQGIMLRGTTLEGNPDVIGAHGLAKLPPTWPLQPDGQDRPRAMIFVKYAF